MKNPAKMFNLMTMFTAFALFSLVIPLQSARADDEAKMDEHQRNVSKDIQTLEEKISEAKEDYKEDGTEVSQKIKAYEDKIAEIKRESSRDTHDMKADMEMKEDIKSDMKSGDKMAAKDHRDLKTRLSDIKKDFNEWRVEKAINKYNKKIAEVKVKAAAETDVDKKTELNEKIAKLDAKNKAAQLKLVDLKATKGENWDKIEDELDATLKEIDEDYDGIQSAN